MPAIPQYRQQTSASQAGLGPGPESVGPNVFSAVAEGLSVVNERLEERAAVAANAEEMAARSHWMQQIEERKQSAEAGAEGFTDSVLKDYDADAMERVGKVKSRRAQAWLKDRLAQARLGIQQEAMGFEAASLGKLKLDGLSSGLDAARTAADFRPDDYDEILEGQLTAISASGLPADARVQMAAQAKSVVAAAAVNGLIRRDPAQALKELSGEKSELAAVNNLEFAARDQFRQEAERLVALRTREAKAATIQGAASRILGVYETAGPRAGTEALAAISASDLDPDTQAEVRAQVLSGVSSLRAQRREEHADELVSVERALGNGTAGTGASAQVDRLYNAGALSPAEYANYQGQIERATKARLTDQEEAANIAAILSAGLPLDPTNAKQVKALGSAFAIDVGQQPVGSPGWQSIALGYAAKARVLPPQAEAWVRQAMRSPNPELRANAALFFGNMEQTAPEATSTFDAATKGYAGLVSSMVNAGTDPIRAAQVAQEATYGVTPQVLEQRREQYRDIAKQNPGAMNSLINRDFDTAFSSQPVPTQAMQADFGQQVQRYFEVTGDIGVARDMAWKDVTRVYGPSHVNGEPTLMMMPPERFGVSPEWVREDLAEWLKSNPQADETAAEDVYLVPDAVTQRNAFSLYDGKPVRPSYKAIGKSGEVLVGADGQVVRYTLPTEDEVRQRLTTEQGDKNKGLVDDAKMIRSMEQSAMENLGRMN